MLMTLSGEDPGKQKLSDGIACMYSTTIPAGGVHYEGCMGQPNGTLCFKCSEGSDFIARPNTTGPDRIQDSGTDLDCSTRIILEGTCQYGVCVNPVTPYGLSCEGRMRKWHNQVSQPPPGGP
jgi:hypothetical protein